MIVRIICTNGSTWWWNGDRIMIFDRVPVCTSRQERHPAISDFRVSENAPPKKLLGLSWSCPYFSIFSLFKCLKDCNTRSVSACLGHFQEKHPGTSKLNSKPRPNTMKQPTKMGTSEGANAAPGTRSQFCHIAREETKRSMAPSTIKDIRNRTIATHS